MAGIGIERDIGEDADCIAMRGLDRTDRATHQIVGVERLRAIIAAPVGLGIGEQSDARNAKLDRFLRAHDDLVDRPARNAGQRSNRFLNGLTLGDEQWPNQVGGGQHRLAHHRAAPWRGAAAAQAGVGIAWVRHAGCLDDEAVSLNGLTGGLA